MTKKIAESFPFFKEARYLRHHRLGIVIWTTPADMADFVTHSEMARRLPGSYDEAKRVVSPLIKSAGYVRMTPGGPECYGRSETLGVKASPEDTVLLRKQLQQRGGR